MRTFILTSFIDSPGRWLGVLFGLTLLLSVASPASARDNWLGVNWHNPLSACAGKCAVHVSIGRHTSTDMSQAFSLNHDFELNPSYFVAPWNYSYNDSFLLTGTVSRRVLTVGQWISAELEAGVGQRFGDMHGTELWGAVYLRWHAFPWNHYIRTTIAVSSGLNYVTKIEDLERQGDRARKSNNLLHYLSPEITFGLPERPNWEFVFRFHHRSGGGNVFGDSVLFRGVTGGANHATAGVRYRF